MNERRSNHLLTIVPMLIVFLVVGCQRPADKPIKSDTTDRLVAQTTIERGPVKVHVAVQPHPARLSDEPTLTLTIDYEQGVIVEKPPFGEALGEFLIRDFREPLPESQGDREVIRQIYTLEPNRTGELQIDPIAVRFTDERAEGDGKEHTLETESLKIEVQSVLADEAPTLDQLEGLAGPVELPRPARASWWLTISLVAIVLGGGVFAWLILRNRRVAEEKQLTPQELAYLELEELLSENLGESDVKLFYVRLTGIVRRYIERTTDVHAPEQTTEEFLREISRGDVFASGDQDRLKAFLESADLVKFAAHQPTPKDVEATFQRAKVFIGLESQEVAA